MTEGAVGLSNGPTSDFEVLNGPASDATNPVSFGHMNQTTASQGPGSITDITLEQALAKVQDLSRENNELQNYLRENNEMMKRQFETLSTWKQKVHEANQTNREKFDQTKALILSLRKDKEELEETISKMKERESELVTRLRTMETAKATSQQVAISLKRQAEEQGMSMTEPDIDIQETVMVAMSVENEQLLQDLQEKVAMQEGNISDLKDTICRREEEVRQFRSSADQLLKDLESTQAIKDDMQKEIAQISEEKFELRQRLHGLISDTTSSLRLVEKGQRGQRAGHGEAEAEKMAARAEAEPVEVTQLIDQLQRTQKQHELQMADLRKEMQGQEEKEKEISEKLKSCEQEKANLVQRHENEIAKVNKEHDQKMMEFIRQHDTEKEQQLQSVASSHDNDVQSLRSQVLTLISEVHETQTKLAAATTTLEKKDTRIKDGEQKVSNLSQELKYQKQESDRIVQHLQIAIENTKKNWEQERAEHQRTKYHFQELQKSFNQLVDDYKELLDTFEQYKQDETHRTQSDRLNELVAQVMAADETLRARQEQVQKLNAEKQRLIEEFQDMECVYKAQAEVYKIDFDAERTARERQVAEKEHVLQEMQALQVSNQRLMDELESLSRRQVADIHRARQGGDGYVVMGSPGRHPHGYSHPGPPPSGSPPAFRPPDPAAMGAVHGQQPPPAPFQHPQPGQPRPHEQPPSAYQGGPSYPPGEDDEPLVCPQCNLQMPDIDSLQIHAVECLDKYEFNPRS